MNPIIKETDNIFETIGKKKTINKRISSKIKDNELT